jgi:undecaprenyl-diphosphatase
MPRAAKNREPGELLDNPHRNWMILGILVCISVIFSIFAHFFPRFPGDLQTSLLFQSVNNDSLLSLTKGITHLIGSWRTPVIVILVALAGWLRAGKSGGLLVILSGIAALVSDPLKEIVGRPRPSPELVNVIMTEFGGSFPSGHTVFAVLVFGTLMYLLVTGEKRVLWKSLSISGCLLVILFIAASRIYLGVHWLSDVIGGLLISSTILFGLIWFYRILKSRFVKENTGYQLSGWRRSLINLTRR